MPCMLRADANLLRGRSDHHPAEPGWALLSDFQHTLGDLLNNLWFERCAAFHRHVDLRDRKFFSPQHCASPKECHQHATKENNLSLRDVSVLPKTFEPIRSRPNCLPRSSDWQTSGQAPGNVRKESKSRHQHISAACPLYPESRRCSMAARC